VRWLEEAEMKRLKNLKIGNKIVLSFVVVIVLMLVILVVTQLSLNTISTDMETFYNEEFQIVSVSQSVMTDLQGYAKGLSRVALAASNVEGRSDADAAAYKTTRINEMNDYLTTMGTDIDTLSGLPLQSQDELTSIKDTYQTLKTQTTQLLALYDNGQVDEGLTLANGSMEQNAVSIREALKTIISRAQLRAQNKHESTMTLVQQQRVLVIGLTVVIAALTIALCLALTRSIKKPLTEMENAAKKLAEGDLSQEIQYHSEDELGTLAESLQATIVAMRLYIKEIDAAMGAIGDRKLNYKSSVEFKGDFVSIKDSLIKISENLTDALVQINTSADQVVLGAEQIAGSGQSLSQATLEQASSVEELSATINDVSDRVRDNADNAVATSRLAEAVGDDVRETSQQVLDMSHAMNQMREMSREITGIIKDIEDIAFQTNILALNAAVEAARAGEAGKGFSVVANEIRQLSGKTAEASRSTSELIGKTVDMMVHSADMAATTSEKLEQTAKAAQDAANKVQAISQASGEQATAVVQLRQSIEQISSVVQENSATAEESAASSEELTSQMQMLKQLVGSFEYDE
jgi:methyl-accepting chemotaxis protein